ncbi:MAG: AbrB/MazE/SpoVT family DNA-binding domain-containing protein [Phycisphaerales bacterium]|nr:AbrB/MazE/SpoVT family DNA-binding domain-containing protein [Phycisphaerales bacterium]
MAETIQAPPIQASLRIAEGGRIVIPANIRSQLKLEVGTEVVMTVKDGQAILMSKKEARRQACERMREFVRRHVPAGVSLSEELMAERKREFENE